jgi:hypothetical protein
MTGTTPPGSRSHGGTSSGQPERAQQGYDPRDLWPRDFGRDGVSGLVTAARALRARDVSRPTEADEELAEGVLADLMARVDGRRSNTR